LIVKNCNHFCEDICYKLTGNSIPKWVNRLARIGIYTIHSFLFRYLFWNLSTKKIYFFWNLSFLAFIVGSFCNCILPDALKTSAVQHDPNFEGRDSEKKRLRTAFSCLSSISMPQMEVSMSSLYLHSHYKGCLPPWQLKKSKKDSLKQKREDNFASH
jgi:hypothetical protein